MIYQKKMYVLLSINFTFIKCEMWNNSKLYHTYSIIDTEKPLIHFTNKIL